MSDYTEIPLLSLTAQLEALLFVAPAPVSTSQLASVLNLSLSVLEKELDVLAEELQHSAVAQIEFSERRIRFSVTPAKIFAEPLEYHG